MQPSIEIQNKNYFENLDGLRAIAAFSVVFHHCTSWFAYPKTQFYDIVQAVLSFDGSGGPLGVIFFFILSGFLITLLLFKEQTKHGAISIGSFYMRRVLRIWPLYYLTILIGFVIYPFFTNEVYIENASGFLYSIFATNFDHIYNGNPSIGILGVQWSVAVEEQFYLIWPLFFFVLGKKEYFIYLLLLLFILSELFCFNADYKDIKYYHLFSNFRFLSFGAILAYFCFYYNKVSLLISKINKTGHFIIYAICITLLLVGEKMSSFFLMRYIVHFLPFLFFGFVIVEQNFSKNSFFKIGKIKVLTWLGKISYGIYLLHMIAIYIIISMFSKEADFVLLKVILSVGLTILLSYLSYRSIESYFLSLKNKFSRS